MKKAKISSIPLWEQEGSVIGRRTAVRSSAEGQVLCPTIGE